MKSVTRPLPNILVTGTPGVGKSTLCRRLSKISGFTWMELSRIAKEHNCLEDYDFIYKCPILNEEKLLDLMEDHMALGGKIVDYHSCEIFPERWFDIIFVLRTENTTLYDRLEARGYTGKKLENNIDCEIFQTILDEARESYDKEIVFELNNTSPKQLEDNLARINLWIQKWKEVNQENEF